MVPAAAIRIDQFGRAAMIADTDHQRVVQHSASFEIQNQSRISFVETREQLIESCG